MSRRFVSGPPGEKRVLATAERALSATLHHSPAGCLQSFLHSPMAQAMVRRMEKRVG